MTWESFLKGLRTINAAMGRKTTTADAEMIWDLVSFIPETAWNAVTQLCIQRWETYPRNIVLALKEQWYSYQGDHYAQDENKTNCDHCHDSQGVIFIVNLEDTEFPYDKTAVVRCGHCQNWKGYMSEKTKKLKTDEIRDKGWNVQY